MSFATSIGIPSTLASVEPTSLASVLSFAGIKTNSMQSFDLLLNNFSYDSTKDILNVLIGTKAAFEYIYITVLIIDKSQMEWRYAWSPTGNYAGYDSPYQYWTLEEKSKGVYWAANSNFKFPKLECSGSRCTQNCFSSQSCSSQGGSVVGGRCLLCGNTQIQQNGICVNKLNCPKNTIEVDGVCVCDFGFYPIGGVCSTCPANSDWDGSACQCSTGFTLKGSSCVAVQSCPNDAIVVNGQCVCGKGFYFDKGSCAKCPSSSYGNNGQCFCFFIWQYFSNGQCLNCPSGTKFNGKVCA